MCEHFGLQEVADYWNSVIEMNDYQKKRFSANVLSHLFNTVSHKKIALFGFAFKKDTNDTRESAAIYVADILINEKANVEIYDPQVSESQIFSDLENVSKLDKNKISEDQLPDFESEKWIIYKLSNFNFNYDCK